VLPVSREDLERSYDELHRESRREAMRSCGNEESLRLARTGPCCRSIDRHVLRSAGHDPHRSDLSDIRARLAIEEKVS